MSCHKEKVDKISNLILLEKFAKLLDEFDETEDMQFEARITPDRLFLLKCHVEEEIKKIKTQEFGPKI